MNESTTFVGLDVHKRTISVAVALEGVEPYSWGKISSRPEEIDRLVHELGTVGTIYTYEAGPCGYALYRRLVELGAQCVVAAPSKIPSAPGDRVKTDRRDALKLVRLLRRGDLDAVWVPSPEQEALRDLTRARQAAQQDLQRVRNRITKMLLRLDLRPSEEVNHWTAAYRKWLRGLTLEQPIQQVVLEELLRALQEAEERVSRLKEQVQKAAACHPQKGLIQALQTMRGIGPVTATTLVGELGDISRFDSPRQLMGYSGLTSTEDSSGERTRRGRISRAGNAHVRHVLGESAWQHARSPKVGKALARKRQGQNPAVVAIAERADERLHRRYYRLLHRGKPSQKAATAVARETLGFIWAIAREIAGLPVAPPRGALKAA